MAKLLISRGFYAGKQAKNLARQRAHPYMEKMPATTMLTSSLNNPAEIIEILRRYHAQSRSSLSGMARAAGLHSNSLNRLNDPKWKPRVDTLQKLHDWMMEEKIVAPPVLGGERDDVMEIPLSGPGWLLEKDSDGWWIVTDEGARGPYTSLRDAASETEDMVA